MFSALRQGSVVYILENNGKLTYKTAQVNSVSSPQFNPTNFAQGNFGGTINISVNDNGANRDFGGLNPNDNIARYNNGKIVISESRDSMIAEVQSLITNSENILSEDNIKYHKSVVEDGKEILASLNPQIAKEQALDKEVKNLHGRVDAMDGKLDKLIALMSGAGNK